MSDTRDTDYYKNITTYNIDKEKETISIEGDTYPLPSLKEIEKYLEKLTTHTLLPLPYFNAKKIKGKKMYEYARE